jgi:nitroimidazol reductase NimA-like FMN-containing flavoprotein (pyridoxamine 5'-phosphate oxidase superfamily)
MPDAPAATDTPAASDDAAAIAPTDRTRLRRLKARGQFERSTIEAILDEGLVAHVGVVDDGLPLVLPMAFARVDSTLYLHGAVANHLLRTVADGGGLCVTVTLLDGLVLSRSWFHHSMNYRCVVVFGTPRVVTDPDEQRVASRALVEHVATGRSEVTRAVDEDELRRTLFLALPIDEASAKIRTGPPGEDPDDLGQGRWGGVLPLGITAGPLVPDADTPAGAPVPDHLVDWRRRG